MTQADRWSTHKTRSDVDEWAAEIRSAAIQGESDVGLSTIALILLCILRQLIEGNSEWKGM